MTCQQLEKTATLFLRRGGRQVVCPPFSAAPALDSLRGRCRNSICRPGGYYRLGHHSLSSNRLSSDTPSQGGRDSGFSRTGGNCRLLLEDAEARSEPPPPWGAV